MGAVHLAHDVLDAQLLDRVQEKIGRVDALLLELQEGQPPIGVELADMTHMRGFDRDIGEQESWRPHALHHVEHYPPKE